MLRLPTIRSQIPELAAGREQMAYLGFLSELLLAECDNRAHRRSERRIKTTGFPRDKSLDLSGVGVWAEHICAVRSVRQRP